MITHQEYKIVQCINDLFRQKPYTYDPEKLIYNERYKRIEFFENKFSDAPEWFLPVIECVRQSSIKKFKSPLEEMNHKIKESTRIWEVENEI